MRNLILALTLILSASSVWAQQPTGMSVLNIFDQFVISKAAAMACLPANPKLDASYDENFTAVYQAAWKRLRHIKFSDVSNDEITKTLDKRIAALGEKVTKDAETEGCNGKAYKELINLYNYHAVWNPYSQ